MHSAHRPSTLPLNFAAMHRACTHSGAQVQPLQSEYPIVAFASDVQPNVLQLQHGYTPGVLPDTVWTSSVRFPQRTCGVGRAAMEGRARVPPSEGNQQQIGDGATIGVSAIRQAAIAERAP